MSDRESFGDGADHDDIDDDELGSEVDILDEEEEGALAAEEDLGTRRGIRKVLDQDRITSNFMTKYERARILGSRALQISKNAPLMIDAGEESDPYKLAEMELQA